MAGPCLLLNYIGQGALLLTNPAALENPFYLLAPEALRLPLLVLATAATIIAAQAVISGAFSLTHQAMQMGYLPRMEVRHTNAHHAGQIYLPELNTMVLLAVLFVALTFHTSDNLAAAYGIAVTGTMGITTLLATAVLHQRLHWPLWAVIIFGAGFLSLDLLFLAANLHKIPSGGWLPLVFGGLLFYLMHTWVQGRYAVYKQILAKTGPLESFITSIPSLLKQGIHRPDRVAVYVTSDLDTVPLSLSYNVLHNHALHRQVVLVKVTRARIPRILPRDRMRLTTLPHGFHTVELNYGFMESPNLPAALNEASLHHGLPFAHREEVSYFLSHHRYVPSKHHALNSWQEPLFMLLEDLSQSAIRFFRLPRSQVVEIGDHIEI